jgi:hypothetical protein
MKRILSLAVFLLVGLPSAAYVAIAPPRAAPSANRPRPVASNKWLSKASHKINLNGIAGGIQNVACFEDRPQTVALNADAFVFLDFSRTPDAPPFSPLPSCCIEPRLVETNETGCRLLCAHPGHLFLMTWEGATIWQRSDQKFRTVTCEDLDQDLIVECYLGGFGVLERISSTGITEWQRQLTVMLGNDKPQRCTISGVDSLVFSVAGGGLIAFGPGGTQTGYWPTPKKLKNSRALIVPDSGALIGIAGARRMRHLLGPDKYRLEIFDLQGNTRVSHEMPGDWGRVYWLHVTPFRVYPSRDPYWAMRIDFSRTTGKALLYIFSPQWQLVYQDVIGSGIGLLAYSPDDLPVGMQRLLVADGANTITEYTPNPHALDAISNDEQQGE